MLNAILDYLSTHATEIGTFLFTSLLALLKRWMDKKKIKSELLSRGMEQDTINKIV